MLPLPIRGRIALFCSVVVCLAVLGFIFYNYFANQSRKLVEDMEYYGSELVNFLTGRID